MVGAENLVGFVWRAAGRQKDDLLKVQVVTHDFGDDEMADMDRIEGSAEYCKMAGCAHLMSNLPGGAILAAGGSLAGQYSIRFRADSGCERLGRIGK